MFGDYKVDPDGFQIAHKMVIFQWQDGKKVVVWPDDLAERQGALPDAAVESAVTGSVTARRPPGLRRAPARPGGPA